MRKHLIIKKKRGVGVSLGMDTQHKFFSKFRSDFLNFKTLSQIHLIYLQPPSHHKFTPSNRPNQLSNHHFRHFLYQNLKYLHRNPLKLSLSAPIKPSKSPIVLQIHSPPVPKINLKHQHKIPFQLILKNFSAPFLEVSFVKIKMYFVKELRWFWLSNNKKLTQKRHTSK